MLLSHAVVLLLLAGFPLWDRWEGRRVRAARSPSARSWSYARAIGGLWATALLVTLTTPLRALYVAPPIPDAWRGAVPADAGPAFLLPVIVGLAVATVVPVVLAAVHPATRERLSRAFAPTAHLFPETHGQRALFALVSISAGCCEELIYRGFLIRYFEAPPWGLALGAGVALSTIAFGAAHTAQGWKGMLGTGIMGLLFAMLYLATGSLLVPVVIHALIDLRLAAISLFVRLPPTITPEGSMRGP